MGVEEFRTELNKAIYRVLTTQFKKNAPEAFAAVEAAGYTVEKWDGNWAVTNPRTGRKLFMSGARYTYLIHGNTFHHRTREYFKFDYVGCLEKPVSTYLRDKDNVWLQRNESTKNYEKLSNAKRDVKYQEDRIAYIQKQLAQLQADLITAVDCKAKRELDLANVRNKLGLSK